MGTPVACDKQVGPMVINKSYKSGDLFITDDVLCPGASAILMWCWFED